VHISILPILKNKIFIFVVLSGMIISCGAPKTTIRPGDTLNQAFIKAMRLYEMERYTTAAESFETIISLGRNNEVGREAQFMLAESYFNNGQYILAASEYKRYREFHPRGERLEDADFKHALAYYKMSPRYKLDQENSKKAIELFNLFLTRYPSSERVDKADGYIQELRNKLAHKNYAAAQLYFRLEQYEAAAIYFDVTINEYPDSEWAEKALAEQINTYILYANRSIEEKKEERYNKAVESYEKYIQLFPRGEHRSKAEEYYKAALKGLDNLESSSVNNQTVSTDSQE